MEGSRPPHGAGGGAARSGFHLGSAARLDELCIDSNRLKQRQILVPPEPRLGEKLGDIIAGEIVPRLMLLHMPGRTQTAPLRPADLSSHVADFADLAIRHEPAVLEAYVKSLLQRGLDLETLLLHLLAPAARRLGALWDDDRIDFVDVTIGASRLQHVLHHLSVGLKKDAQQSERHVLLIPAPGEQHTFGLLIVSEFFRREGWQVSGGLAMTVQELHRLIAEQSFVLIGFSVSCDRLINTLCSTIQAVRRLSRNQSVLVMAGGRIFAQDPSLRPWVGADLVAADASEALELAGSVLKRSAVRRRSHHP